MIYDWIRLNDIMIMILWMIIIWLINDVYTVYVIDNPIDVIIYLTIQSYELLWYAYLIPQWSYHEHDNKDN